MLLKKIPGFDHRRISTIQNFSTDVMLAPDTEVVGFLAKLGFGTEPYFIVAGKKSYGKGSDVAVAAMHLVVKKGVHTKILFVGKGVLAGGKGEHYIVDHPSVPLPLLLGLVSRAAALVIPGRWQEGLHRTMIDALALCVPIICTEAGAPPVEGVRDGLNGRVVACNDAGTLADAMTDILRWGEKEKRTCKEESLRLFSERFSDGVIMDKWINLFYDLAGNGSVVQ
jgi:glycosyltransferase involved in cell wall biosynthesis